jgi:hypothetical protein
VKQHNTISGTEAIALMRRLSREFREPFVLHHQTFDELTGLSKGMRIVKKCLLRVSLPSDIFNRGTAELYLPYIDLDLPKSNQKRMCRKKLITHVAFPPAMVLLKVDWYNGI